MNAFLIDLENKVGELARITEAIAARGVNITAVTGSTCDTTGSVALMTADEAATRTALQDVRCSFREIEATETAIRNVPGALATACRRLAEGGVNIEALMPTGMQGDDVMVAFVTSDPAKARNILSHSGSASA